MINRAMDFVFTDSFAFAINATLGTVVGTKLCNYSWEEKIRSEATTEEIRDRAASPDEIANHQIRESHS
ncbi:hypothetical protein G7B40_006235 [Aetokthonos hydrillicola Thurmond2011]|jgi:hypothetical protein|uniref:Uncharacterized protein n=1 Tax=Aetokthonos hydrillicola Thurmond2011 TaxID=2712845 RepID=A0AAP5M6J7_9CYAN|nr:hypothetical protein [Aetokthonos hydrillicola]MBO3464365.1 hypothetical protein [Aetokthonos hydrillicola CCALA 1050]MBW4585071.1 hypothetical protein [Aetokthonos hydrillicola CCALA 1050]MDR9894170.1 hypothetical protein [Aetokthonos hydrillicola Thurmond2011]